MPSKGKSKSPQRKSAKLPAKQFKSEIKKLKQAGVTKVDLRKVKQTPYWRNKLKDFRGVVNGKQVAVKLSPKQRAAAGRGANIKGSFQILPKLPGSKIIKDKRAPLGYKIRFASGVTKIDLPPIRKRESVRAYLERLRKTVGPTVKGGPGASLSYNIHGNSGNLTYEDFDQMIDDIEDEYADAGPSAFTGFTAYQAEAY
jgi:hypothetical protein